MQRSKVMIQGNGIVTCLSKSGAMKRIKELDESTWVKKAYQGAGYIGFNLATGNIDEHPALTTIKLYERPKNKDYYLSDLQNLFRQNWQRLRHEIEGRVKFFYTQNCPIT